MTDDYLPGADRFYIYFAIAIPLILFVVALGVLVSLGYGGDQSWIIRGYRKWRRASKFRLGEKDV